MTEAAARCRAELLATARSLRLGMDAQGNEAFVLFIDALQAWFAEPAGAQAAAAISPHLAPLLEAQQRADTLRMADVLEYAVLPLLGD